MGSYVIEFPEGFRASYRGGKWYCRVKKMKNMLRQETDDLLQTLPDTEKMVVEEMIRRHQGKMVMAYPRKLKYASK